jgi:anthranilate synthase component 1
MRFDSRRFALELSDPLATYRAMSKRYGEERVFLLESLSGPDEDMRSSVVGILGPLTVAVRENLVEFHGTEKIVSFAREVLSSAGLIRGGRLTRSEYLWDIPTVLSGAFQIDADSGLEGGFLVVYGYDSVHYLEQLPKRIQCRKDGSYDAVFSLVESLASFNLKTGETVAWTLEIDLRGVVIEWLEEPPKANTAPLVPRAISISDEMSKLEFTEIVERCLERIRAGDIYQVQIGHEVTVRSDATPAQVYLRIRDRNPSPYMGLVPVLGKTIVCCSPELYIRVEGSNCTMRPIAGTARKEGVTERDREAMRELMKDPKEHAEHIMLVDLCRNDLCRVAQPASLVEREVAVIEEYSHVYHIVSEVSCRLDDGFSVADAVKAGFPAGTMTGAPKVMAMSIIEEHEKSRRGYYGGAFGIMGHTQSAVLALGIRMAVHSDGFYSLRASAGIVADSSPSGEWQETLNKLAAMYWAVTGEELA